MSTANPNLMADKSFKAPRWMLKALHDHAHAEDIRDSDWIRKAILDRLLREGFDPETSLNKETQTNDSL